MNAIDFIPQSSRDSTSFEYMRLIVQLPPTFWEVFAEDGRYAALINTISSDVRTMLQRTRPLFVQLVLEAMLVAQEQQAGSTTVTAGHLTADVLSAAKIVILREKARFGSYGGLYAQLALLHATFIASTTDEPQKDTVAGTSAFSGQQAHFRSTYE